MAARVFILSILFTEVLRPACLAGLKEVCGGVGGLNGSKSEYFEHEVSGGLGIRLETQPSGNVLVEWKRGAVLECTGGSDQSVSWFRNGTAAPPCGSIRCNTTARGKLRFKIGKKHGEKGSKNNAIDKRQSPESYHCVVRNNVGSLRSTTAKVQIPYLSHEFKKSPQNVTVHQGEVARLSCSIDSIPSQLNITWQLDKKTLSFDYKTKYFMVSPGVLYINATKLSDAGQYRCVATNEYSKKKARKSKEAKLSVNPINEAEKSTVATFLFPQISYSYHLIIGSNLTLVCASSGFPSLVIWTFTSQQKDGAAIEQPHLLFNSTNSLAVLILKNIKVADAGDYRCSVNSLGKTLQTQSITVNVLIPPTFIKKPVNQAQCSGKSVRFECQAQGRPMPKIHWLKDSEHLATNPRIGTYMKDGNKMDLTISSTIPDDSGIYQCVAVNPAGEIWTAARLQITYLPQSPPAPTSLHCRAVSTDKILLYWKMPQTVSSSNSASWITVHYAVMEPGYRENTALPDENSSSIEVKALEPFTNYSMYARNWTSQAASNQSATVQCSTAASVPIAAPTVTAEPISSTKLNVSWIPLNRKEARGYVVEYKLQWRPKDNPFTKVRNLSSALSQYTITDLTPGTLYEVRVLARTKQGWPNVSDSLFNWTEVIMPLADYSQSPLSKLVNLDVVNVDASTIKVEWKMKNGAALQKKNFDSWELYYQNEAGKKLFVISLAPNFTEYLFTELAADTSYGIGLCMITSGEPDVCLLRQLDYKRPVDDYALTDVEGVPDSSTSIKVSWSARPCNMEQCYEVCRRAVHSPDSEPSDCRNTTNTTITFRHLKPYTLYQFKIRVLYNTSGHGNPYSETIECQTDEDVPGPVNDVGWFLLNSTGVRIDWKQPSKLNGVIRNYTVSYISGPLSTPSKQWTNVTVPGINTTANLPGLAYSTLYFVEVRAANNAGYGKPSERIMIYTGVGPKNSTDTLHGNNQPSKPVSDQSLGIIVGVSISTCCIIICLSSIYCRKKWENIQSPRESSQSLKDQVILRNRNGCCLERNSVSTGQHVPAAVVTNEVELAILCPPSPKTTNPHDPRSNGIAEPCLKEPLLTTWDSNGDSKDLNISENFQYKPRSSTGSNQLPEQELDGTQVTTLNYTAGSSGTSLNNNLELSESLSSLVQPLSTTVPVIGPNG